MVLTLNKKQVKRYINLFEESDYRAYLRSILANTTVYVKLKDDCNENDFEYELWTDNGYDDEFNFEWFISIYYERDYRSQQERYREEALYWQQTMCDKHYGWLDIAEKCDYFYKVAKRYGLVREFRENAIL